MLTKNSEITVEIISISNDGNGIAKHDGCAVFVPFSAAGDTLRVKIVKAHKTYAFAIIKQIIKPSQHRALPQCEIYSKCGGCCFAHMSYKAELDAKQSFVQDAMTRIGNISVPVQSVLALDNEQRYRNKVQFPLCEQNGKIKTGFYAARSHRVVPCNDCVLQPELLNNIAKTCCEALEMKNISVYNEENHTGLVRHIYLRHAQSSNKVLLCFVINAKNLPHSGEICNIITQKHKEIESIVVNVNTQKTNVILGKTCKTIFGTGILNDEICNVPVRLDPLSFFQVNTKGAELLYNTAAEMAQLKESDVLLDLYCGTGTIGLAMMKRMPCKQLIGVEIIPQAVESAKINAKESNIQNATFICASTSEAVQELQKSGTLPDVVVMDPPRKGSDEITLNAVIAMAPQRIVMISCNAPTAARDVKYLCENNYTVKSIMPVDLFPRTKHVECIILMTRCDDI